MDVRLSTEAGADGAGALVLRPWEKGDAQALVAVHRDPLLRERLNIVLDSAADAQRWLLRRRELWEAGVGLSFAVLERDDLVGHVVLKQGGERAADTAEVGYWTAGAARGRGVAPRAVEAVTAWALAGPRSVPLARVELIHDVENAASCRVAVKCGFRMEAVLAPHPPKWPAPGHLHVRTRD